MLPLRKTGKGTQDHSVLFLKSACGLTISINILIKKKSDYVYPLFPFSNLSSGRLLLAIPHVYIWKKDLPAPQREDPSRDIRR